MIRPARFARPLSRRGFTLVEMLVTLAIMSMIAALLWQGMQGMFRVERLLQRSGVEGQLVTVRREWVRSLVRAGEVEPLGAERRWKGDSSNLQLASTEALNLPGMGGHVFNLTLSDAPEGSVQSLRLVEVLPSGVVRVEPPRSIELLQWRGRPGRLRYLDGERGWVDQWPPPESLRLTGMAERDLVLEAQAMLPRLPAAVWIELGEEAGGPLVAEVATSEPGRLRRQQWERQ